MSPDELAKYVQVMRDMGVTTFKHGELEITLGTAPAKALPPRDPDAPSESSKPALTYDQFLFACTEGLPEDADV